MKTRHRGADVVVLSRQTCWIPRNLVQGILLGHQEGRRGGRWDDSQEGV